VVFNSNGDEGQSLAALVLLAKHAQKFDDMGMVELAPRQPFDA
jgi:hypothetical protein